jgi:hypothetical protein
VNLNEGSNPSSCTTARVDIILRILLYVLVHILILILRGLRIDYTFGISEKSQPPLTGTDENHDTVTAALHGGWIPKVEGVSPKAEL